MTRRQPVAPAAARYRNDPQVRALVADNAQPAPVLTAPPVTAPPVAPRPPQGRAAPRPPFEGRAPSGFAGRPEGARPDAARADGGRPDGGRPDGARPDGGRPDGGRPEGTADRRRSTRLRSSRWSPRSAGRRRAASRCAARWNAVDRGTADGAGARRAPSDCAADDVAADRCAAAYGRAPGRRSAARESGNVREPVGDRWPPVGSRGVLTEPSTGRPNVARRPAQRSRRSGHVVHRRDCCAGPAQRPADGGDRSARPPGPRDARADRGRDRGRPRGAPGLRGLTVRRRARACARPDTAGCDSARNDPAGDDAPAHLSAARGRCTASRCPACRRGTTSGAANRPAEAAAVAPRPAAAVAPPAAPPAAVQRAPEARPPEAQRPPGGDGKMNRPEAPRGRGDERPQDKAEKQK